MTEAARPARACAPTGPRAKAAPAHDPAGALAIPWRVSQLANAPKYSAASGAPSSARAGSIWFPLTPTGANLLGNSYEHQSTGGPRAVLGGRAVLSSAVPEPAAWAMMIVGFGLAGTTQRTRVRKVAAA